MNHGGRSFEAVCPSLYYTGGPVVHHVCTATKPEKMYTYMHITSTSLDIHLYFTSEDSQSINSRASTVIGLSNGKRSSPVSQPIPQSQRMGGERWAEEAVSSGWRGV